MTKQETFIIVGASLTEAKASEALRAQEFDGCIALLGADRDCSAERTPLSKEHLHGESPRQGARARRELAATHPGLS
jgi:3-phenylpropionate/trans-cinnamate dioxygenase ferredoxin reductase component